MLRFGRDYDPDCKLMDYILLAISETVKAKCDIFLVDIGQVTDFTQEYAARQPFHSYFG